jgi:hypothetical protein
MSFFDALEILRRHADRRRRQGFPLHPRRTQRRAHLDRGRMHRRCLVVHQPG